MKGKVGIYTENEKERIIEDKLILERMKQWYEKLKSMEERRNKRKK